MWRRMLGLLLLAGCGQPETAAADLAGGSAGDLAGGQPDLSTTGDGGGDASGVICALDSTEGFLALVDAVVTNMRSAENAGSNALVVPSSGDRDAFAARVVAILGGDESQACDLPASYRLLRLPALRVIAELDANGTPSAMLGWGTYAAPRTLPVPSRRLAVEAPHPIFDSATEHQAADLFLQTSARWFLLAGAHRCADAAASGCSGTTTACGADAPFRISDAAHAVQLPFWAVHAALSQADAQLAFLQLHGNGASCPSALVSDSSGTWSDTGLAGQLADALIARGVAVGKCGAGYPTAACNLCGTDNVEARFTAAATDACTMMGTQY
jgi:hypothetical protein